MLACHMIMFAQIKYSGVMFGTYICKMFSSVMWHNYLPLKMMNGEIKQKIKDNMLWETKLDNLDQ